MPTNPFLEIAKTINPQPQGGGSSAPVNPFVATSGLLGTQPAAEAKPLPFMAVGLTEKGTPVYGEGFSGWTKGVIARLMDPALHSEGMNYEKRDEIVSNANTWTNNLVKKNPGLSGLRDYIAPIASAFMLDKEQMLSGNVHQPLQNIRTGTGVLINQGIFPALNVGSATVRKALVAGEFVEDYLNESNTIERPDWMPDNTMTDIALGTLNITKKFDFTSTAIRLLKYGKGKWGQGEYGAGIASFALAPISLLAGPLSSIPAQAVAGLIERGDMSADEKRIADRKLLGSNMVYSALFDEMARSNIERELAGGASILDIEEKYSNPWVELAFGAVLDPLNFVGALGTPEKALAKAAGSKALFNTPEGMKLVDAAMKAINDPQSAKAATDLVEYLIPKIKLTTTNVVELAKNYAPSALTSSSLRQNATENFASFISGMHMSGANPEDMAEMVRQGIKLVTSVDKPQQVEAVTSIMGSKLGRMVLGDNGLQSMSILKSILGDDDLVEFGNTAMKLAREGGDEWEKFAFNRMKQATEDMFPSVTEMEDAAKEVTKLTKLGEEVPPRLKKLADAYENVPGYVKAINSGFSASSPVGKLYRKANTLFSNVYMGVMVPAFAVRNYMQNSLHAFVDTGIKGGLEAAAAGGEQLVRGIPGAKKLFGEGAINERYVAEMTEMLGPLWKEALGTKNIDSELNLIFKSMGVSGNVENAMKLAIFRNTVVKEMRKAAKFAMPDFAPAFSKAGFTEQEGNLFYKLFLDNNGDIAKTSKQFIASMNNGSFSQASLIKIPDRMRDMLSQLGGLDKELLDRLHSAKSADELAAGIDDVWKQLLEYAEKHGVTDPSTITPGTPDLEIANAGKGLFKELFGKESDKIRVLYEHAISASQGSRKAMMTEGQDLIKKLMREVNDRVAQGISKPEDAQIIERLSNAQAELSMLNPIFGESGPKLAKQWQDVAETLVDKKNLILNWDKVKYTKPDGTVVSLWKKMPKEGKDPRKLVNEAWNWFWREKNVSYAELGDSQIAQYLDILERAGIKNDALAKNSKISEAFANNEEARELFDVITEIKGGVGGTSVSIEDQINAVLSGLASRKTLNGFEEAGRPLTKNAKDLLEKFYYHNEDSVHSIPRAVREQLIDLKQDWDRWKMSVSTVFDTPVTTGKMTKEKMDALLQVSDVAGKRMAEAQAYAVEFGREKVNFALHSYSNDKTYVDAGLAFIMPYQYWYRRTYSKWMKRMVSNPAMVAAYSKYRHALEVKHAGMPDWWKYNLSTNDLPGVETDNPLYFNLEASLNPLNGMTGIDFNDPNRRVDWLSRSVDELGKFGPSMFTPLSWAVAAAMYAKGETEAGQRWMGRLIPQTASLKSLLTHMGVKGRQDGYGKYNEFDPFVSIFSGGLDPYERRRVGRMLGGMVEKGATLPDGTPITREMAIDAANTQKGELWDMAVRQASDARFAGQMASFVGGVGFKSRSNYDVQTDEFYTKYFGLMNMRDTMTAEDYKDALVKLGEEYPFMDTLLISRKSDNERMSAYTYNVLGRIAPGQKTELLESVGINEQMINRFYEDKGEFKDWTPQDVQRFISGVTDLGAMLKLPDDAKSYEWNQAKSYYSAMNEYLKSYLGDDIMEKVDVYFSLESEDRKLYIASHPEVKAYFDGKSVALTESPMLFKYYGSIDTIERQYNNQMYTYLEQKFGADISQKYSQYMDMKVYDDANGTKTASAYYKAHPELKAYTKEKGVWKDEITRKMAEFQKYIPEAPPPDIRPDFVPQGQVQEEMLQVATPVPQVSWEQWQTILGGPMSRIVQDYFAGGDLKYNSEQNLDYLAPKYGFESGREMLQAIGSSIRQ